MKITKYILYWAHLPEHTNPMTEGYIGISKNSLKERRRDHEYDAKKGSNNLFKHKIREYGDLIIWQVIGRSFSKNGAQTIENSFRPTQNIAWNTQEGGGDYPILKGDNHYSYGKKCPDISERQLGNKNHMYGNTHNETYINWLKSNYIGEKNPCYRNLKHPHFVYMYCIMSNEPYKVISNKLNISVKLVDFIKYQQRKFNRYDFLLM